MSPQISQPFEPIGKIPIGGQITNRMPIAIERIVSLTDARVTLQKQGVGYIEDLLWMSANGLSPTDMAKNLGVGETVVTEALEQAAQLVGSEVISRIETLTNNRPQLGVFSPSQQEKMAGRIKGLPREKQFISSDDLLKRLSDLKGATVTPTAIDHRSQMSPVRDQGGRGTCTAFAATALREYFENIRTGRGQLHDFSEEFTYWLSRRDSNIGGDGYGTGAAANHYVTTGGCLETDWPYDGRFVFLNVTHLPVPTQAIDGSSWYKMDAIEDLPDRDVQAIKDCLTSGKVAAISTPVYWAYWNGLTGVITMPPDNILCDGWHGVCVVGWYDDTNAPGGGYLIFKNSWGMTSASNSPLGAEYRGYYLMPYQYYEKLTGDTVTFRDKSATSPMQWQAEYFKNEGLEGIPDKVEYIDNIDFNWGGNGPFNQAVQLNPPLTHIPSSTPVPAPVPAPVQTDNFSVRWTRIQRFKPGWYRFWAEADDGIRVWVDDHLLINDWRLGASRKLLSDLKLTAGDHLLRVEYFEHGGGAIARFGFDSIPWSTEYFASSDLTGTAYARLSEADLDLKWCHQPPYGVNTWNFSLRSQGTIRFPESGFYRFRTNSTGGVRVKLDGVIVFDTWTAIGGEALSTPVNITAGDHKVVLEFKNTSTNRKASVKLDWFEDVWRTEFYNNRNLDGLPILRRTDATLNFNWGTNTPDPVVNTDNFSARFTRTICVTAGYYTFSARSDDELRVTVDGRRIIETRINTYPSALSADVYLSDGTHNICVEFCEYGGDAVCQVNWERVAWMAQYFPNTDLAGTPVMRTDNDLHFDWGTDGAGVPGIPADNFSVRWMRTMFLAPGRYRCLLRSDDGVRFYVDDALLISRWRDQGNSPNVCEFDTIGGNVKFVIEYYDRTGAASISFDMTQVGWLGEYYPNKDLSGVPSFYRIDPDINFDWSLSPPDPRLQGDNFSVRWRRTLKLPIGRYRLKTTTDDGIRVWVDGRLVIDQWRDLPLVESSVLLDLVGRPHDVVVEYHEHQASATCRVTWERQVG